MKRIFIIMLSLSGLLSCVQSGEDSGTVSDREYWVETMDRIARPVIWNLASGTLNENMPVESVAATEGAEYVSRLEAFGRTMCGIAHWIELDRMKRKRVS